VRVDLMAGRIRNALQRLPSSNALVRLVLQNGIGVKAERYLHELQERIRDVQQAADASLYLVTDSDNGLVLRVRPFR
jgi:glucose/arabinose dehydrogenase